ncbi:MAG: hypothetical protein CL917_18970 [Deltaproteobacteria bacterium]|nr:hypothetical protein [Deltaproteobacteria bacterium]
MYSPKQLKIARTVVLAVWIFAAASFFFPLYYTDFGGVGRTLFGLLIAVHLIEFPIFMNTYRETEGSLLSHFPKHMAYGVVYHAEVKQKLNQP